MKRFKNLKYLFFSTVMCFFLSACNPGNNSQNGDSSNHVSVDLSYKNIVAGKSNSGSLFDEFQVYADPGEPLLPKDTVKFLLPKDADLETISISIDGLKEENLSGTYEIEAALPPTFDGSLQWPKDKNIVDGKDIDIYETNAFYPANYYKSFSTGKMCSYQIVEVEVSPFKYNPVSKKLKKIISGKVKVNYELKSSQTRSMTRTFAPTINELKFKETLKETVVNYDQGISSYISSLDVSRSNSRSTSTSYDYVIITTSAIKNSSTELQNFVNAVESVQGLSALVVTENTWGGGTGDAAAENIRAWLQSNYQDMAISYVLLIGDPSPSDGDVPMKMCYPRNNYTTYKEAPTDFYYAELTGNWDYDGDGYYGEYSDDTASGGADKYSEVNVGRIPYYGSITDLDNILEKIVSYESASDISWRKNVLLPMKPSDSSTDGYQLGEAIKNNFLEPNGWSYHRIYDTTNSYSGNEITGVTSLNPAVETSPCSITNVTNTWVNNNFGMVVWWTHGSSTSASSIMNTSYAASLNDNYPSFTFQVSCHNAYPENSGNLAYTLLKNGAVSTIAATRVSWYYVGQSSFTGTSPTNAVMAYRYSQYIIENNNASGEALAKVRSNLNKGSLWMNYLVFNLYGCPSLKLVNETSDPVLSLNKNSVDFGYVTSESQVSETVVCKNIGGGSLEIEEVSSDNSHISASLNGNYITITPDASGLNENSSVSGNITVNSNGGNATISVTFRNYMNSNYGTTSQLNLSGEAFDSWSGANSNYQFTLVGDYTWELTFDVGSSLTNTPYKITYGGSWDTNWGGGASGTTASLSRGGDNATVSLAAGNYTLRLTEGTTISDPISVKWICNSSTALTIHFLEWESATTYSVHAWDGLAGDYEMTYEGYFNGSYWWVISIPGAPDDFWFTFTNSNGSWEGNSSYDRHYENQANEIYVKSYDSTIYTSRP